MTLDRFMDMAKADRYTEEGRQTVNDARRYKVGEISEKTGLQKQNDGSWAPPKTGKGIPKEKAAGLNLKQRQTLNKLQRAPGYEERMAYLKGATKSGLSHSEIKEAKKDWEDSGFTFNNEEAKPAESYTDKLQRAKASGNNRTPDEYKAKAEYFRKEANNSNDPEVKAAWNDAAEKAEKLATKPAGKAVQSFIDAIKSGAIGYDPVTTSYIDAEHAKNFNTKLKSHLKASGEDFNSSVKPVVYSPSYKESLLKNGFDAPAELKQENKADAEAAVSALRKEGLDAVAVKRSDSLIDNSYAVYIRPGSKPAGNEGESKGYSSMAGVLSGYSDKSLQSQKASYERKLAEFDDDIAEFKRRGVSPAGIQKRKDEQEFMTGALRAVNEEIESRGKTAGDAAPRTLTADTRIRVKK